MRSWVNSSCVQLGQLLFLRRSLALFSSLNYDTLRLLLPLRCNQTLFVTAESSNAVSYVGSLPFLWSLVPRVP